MGQVIPAPRKAPGGRAVTVNRGGTIAVAPSGARVSVETEDGALELAEQGFYDVRTQGAGADSATTLASNVDLTRIGFVAARSARAGGGGGGARARRARRARASARPSDEAQAQAQRLWWYLLVAGGLLLAAETLLSNRLSQKGARVS